MKYSIPEHESIDGLYVIGGAAIVCGLHPTKITVTDSAITFDYTVGGQPVSRAYALTKADGKITSVTAPDGANVEVEHIG